MARSKKTSSTKLSLLILLGLVVALVCGYVGAVIRGGGGSTAEAAASSGSWIDEVKERGELRVGVAIAPPMTVQTGDDLGGPNLIPAQNLADALDVRLTAVPASWSNIVAGLQADRYDLAANLDLTVERSLSIGFTDPIYEYQGVFVTAAANQFVTAADLLGSGQPIAVAQGAAPGAALAANGAQTLELGDYTNAFQAVQADRAAAVFTDLPTAESQVQTNPDFKIVVPDPAIYAARAGYGVDKDIDEASMQILNIAINAARDSGELERAYVEQNYVTIDQLGDLEKR